MWHPCRRATAWTFDKAAAKHSGAHYLVNGFNAGRDFGGPRDLSGIESVDVLKGPRAALLGRGEPGGTVNLVTKRPTFKKAGKFRVSAGSFETYRADADWTAPLSDAVAVRLVGFFEDAGSYRDTVETQKYGASPSLAWRISAQSRLVDELELSHQEIPFDRFSNVVLSLPKKPMRMVTGVWRIERLSRLAFLRLMRRSYHIDRSDSGTLHAWNATPANALPSETPSRKPSARCCRKRSYKRRNCRCLPWASPRSTAASRRW
jgi:outer membrane receptor protein involved in Fe transport